MNDKYDDNIQHGIDDDPNNDPEKARNIGGVGGAITGAIAGAAAGPLGAIGGAIIGGVVAGLGSQAAVGAIDKIDNDNTITGIGDGVTDKGAYADNPTGTYTNATTSYTTTEAGPYTPTGVPNGVPGIQTGGHAIDGTPDTRGIIEKTEDTLTGDPYDDKTGKRVDGGNWDNTATVGNGVPGVQTGGHALDGTPDTRGIMEKTADTLTGDKFDDKTGKRID